MTSTCRSGPMPMQGTRPRRGLPRTVRPVQDETVESYLDRLAVANRITTDRLVAHIGGKLTKKTCQIDLNLLAHVSRQPTHTLARALPQLRVQSGDATTISQGRNIPDSPNMVRAACRRCMAAKGIAQIVKVWTRHDQNVCLRHRLWIGGGVEVPRDQVDLAGHPNIIQAQIRHNRLLRCYDRRLVHIAYSTARRLYDDITHRGYGLPYLETRDLRRTAHFDDREWLISHRDPIHHALNYPEVITLTGLLASPHWRPFAQSRSSADRHRFHLEFWRRIPTDYPIEQPASLNFRITMLCLPAATWMENLAPNEIFQPASETATGPIPGELPDRPAQLQTRHAWWLAPLYV